MRREDMVLGAFILVPILCLIIPVPLFLLDLLFALNIALSMIILFNALFSKEPLDMSASDVTAFDDVISIVVECQFYKKYFAEGRCR